MTIYNQTDKKLNETVEMLCDFIQDSLKSNEVERIESLPHLVSSLAQLIN